MPSPMGEWEDAEAHTLLAEPAGQPPAPRRFGAARAAAALMLAAACAAVLALLGLVGRQRPLPHPAALAEATQAAEVRQMKIVVDSIQTGHYVVHPDMLEHSDAFSFCAGLGSAVITPEDQEDLDAACELLPAGNQRLWVGIERISGEWQRQDKKPLTWLPWAIGEGRDGPNAGMGCGPLIRGKWFDFKEDSRKYWTICSPTQAPNSASLKAKLPASLKAKLGVGKPAHSQPAAAMKAQVPSTFTTSTTELGCPKSCTPTERVVPDVVIPFFERDLCKLKYTAQSLGAHDPRQNLGDVYLMWVSNNPASDYTEDLAEVVETLSKSRKVHLFDFSTAMKSYDLDGWHAQQLLKLKISSVVQSEFYLVMDSKNTLIKDIEEDTFFTSCNQARIFAQFNYSSIPSPHNDWYAKAASTLGVDPPLDKPFPASITPILLHRKTVLDMLAYIGEGAGIVKLCDGPMCPLFGVGDASGQGTTEFTMYNMFSYTKTKLECTSRPEKHEEDAQDQWGLSLWRGVAENKEQVMKENLWTLRNITQGILQPIMFGSQPSALDDLTKKQRAEAEVLLETIYEDAGAYKKSDSKSTEALVACAIGSYEYGKNEKKFN